MERKLAAIFSADVQGYSRLMGDDEEATVRTLTTYREVMTSLIEEHRGRVVDSPGDNLLAEFASVVDAVQCAVNIQQELTTRNAALPDHRKMQFRIGINLGDVIVEGERLYGDGVNIAARMEGLAEGGGLCLSGTAYDQVENKLPLGYAYLGEQMVKNIAKPVRAYHVVMEPQAATDASRPPLGPMRQWRQWRWVVVAAVVVLLMGSGVVAWYTFWRLSSTPALDVAQETLGLDMHRIAVLPFDHISPNPDDEYFADGMTDELISLLSKIRGLQVIARTSVMAYKGTNKSITDIGRELQVGTILEGSVRKVENQVWITAQLIDVASQAHLWSETYDREFEAIFAMQRDIATQVIEALQVKLIGGEQTQLAKHGTDNLEAYNFYLRGRYFHNMTKEGLNKSKAYYEQALAKDPNYALAYAGLAYYYQALSLFGAMPPQQAYAQSQVMIRKALELDDSLAEVYTYLARDKMLYEYDWRGAEQALKRAMALEPSYARAYGFYGGYYLRIMGRCEEGMAMLKSAQQLDPLSREIIDLLGWTYHCMRQYDQAIKHFRLELEMVPNALFGNWGLSASYIQKGMYDEAIAAKQKVVDLLGGTPMAIGSLGWTLAMAGKKDEAQKLLDTLKERAQHENASAMGFAWLYMALGEMDQAFAWLDKAYEERHFQMLWIKGPWYDNLHADPRYETLLKKMSLPTD